MTAENAKPPIIKLNPVMSREDVDALMKEYLDIWKDYPGRTPVTVKVGTKEYTVGYTDEGKTQVRFLFDKTGHAEKVQVPFKGSTDLSLAQQFDERFASTLKDKNLAHLEQAVKDTSLDWKTGRDAMQQTLNKLYTKLYEYVSEGLKESQKTGKPLFIAVGEKHKEAMIDASESQLESTVVEAMVVDIAQKLGVRRLYIELDRKGLSHVLLETQDFQGQMDAIAYDTSYHNNMRVRPGDPAHETHDPKQRKEGILKTIEDCNVPSVGLYGAAHLKEIGQSKLSDTHTIRLINAANLNDEEKAQIAIEIMRDGGDGYKQKMRQFNRYAHVIGYMYNPEKVFQADVEGDMRSAAAYYTQIKKMVAQVSLEYEQRDITGLEVNEQDYVHQLESFLTQNKITLHHDAKKELTDLYVMLKASGNQLQSEAFSKELDQFTAQLTPAVKTQIDKISR